MWTMRWRLQGAPTLVTSPLLAPRRRTRPIRTPSGRRWCFSSGHRDNGGIWGRAFVVFQILHKYNSIDKPTNKTRFGSESLEKLYLRLYAFRQIRRSFRFAVSFACLSTIGWSLLHLGASQFGAMVPFFVSALALLALLAGLFYFTCHERYYQRWVPDDIWWWWWRHLFLCRDTVEGYCNRQVLLYNIVFAGFPAGRWQFAGLLLPSTPDEPPGGICDVTTHGARVVSGAAGTVICSCGHGTGLQYTVRGVVHPAGAVWAFGGEICTARVCTPARYLPKPFFHFCLTVVLATVTLQWFGGFRRNVTFWKNKCSYIVSRPRWFRK